MKEFFKNFLLMISIISFTCGLVVTALIFMGEFFGYNKTENLLKKLNVPLNNNGIIVVGLICVSILALSYFLRKKFFG